MKTFKINIFLILALALFTFSCQEDDAEFGDFIAPTNLQISAEIIGVDASNPNGDGSGRVILTATADNAISYNFEFGDGQNGMFASGIANHRFSLVGLNTYTVVVSAIGTGGNKTIGTITIDVFSSFDDYDAKLLLSGGAGSTKTWYWAAADIAHLGVGPANASIGEGFWYPQWYAAQPFEKAGSEESSCIYEDQLVFSLDANEQLTYQLNNNGSTYFNGAYESVVGGTAGYDFCYEYDTSGTSLVTLAPTSVDWTTVPDPNFTSRGTVMNFSDSNFMGYYVGASSYEIIELTSSLLRVRCIDAQNPDLAWYHTFTTQEPTQGFTTQYNTLVWQEEFDVDGAPNPANWTYDLGAGGWGNQEAQTYTNNAENAVVTNGNLVITAINTGSGYTSARLKSENLFEFTYGRVEVRAKLPTGGGTWPAIWMLGANYDTVTWPACGEIDIMEHVGNNQNTIHGTLHYPEAFGGNADGSATVVDNVSSEFHNYTVEWTPTAIKIVVDDTVFHTYANTASSPFNSDFFLILNVAMGGTFGGDIDPAFTQSSMEIDYVRVYQ
ncbi:MULTISPECIES: glycoside hydrolase family 16 protein [Mesoflavibacter]|uniref:Glycoside hydrolase family 16 protein n=1 Tax=Mesoflavibacter profundi TaxID=2708110 RepID=A0ABT4RWX7_9FLAO|nr:MULTISPECIES: glycoside hydrolase family 16 protein [Mesoflavibacter]MDA0176328.1 glycoside hydrolase family 16 protein [Mesoflavibacter profundi]QIJ89968.1 Beta-glucanase precursor [Mesoflavibacter sp. HG96]QIJ92696.1 Beta-glucanase precursor [Mesoflavibacter sp. HG37]